MGPRFFDRGNPERDTRIPDDGHASMGPRFFDRGNMITAGKATVAYGASMGPRFFDRGNVRRWTTRGTAISCFNGAAVL